MPDSTPPRRWDVNLFALCPTYACFTVEAATPAAAIEQALQQARDSDSSEWQPEGLARIPGINHTVYLADVNDDRHDNEGLGGRFVEFDDADIPEQYRGAISLKTGTAANGVEPGADTTTTEAGGPPAGEPEPEASDLAADDRPGGLAIQVPPE